MHVLLPSVLCCLLGCYQTCLPGTPSSTLCLYQIRIGSSKYVGCPHFVGLSFSGESGNKHLIWKNSCNIVRTGSLQLYIYQKLALCCRRKHNSECKLIVTVLQSLLPALPGDYMLRKSRRAGTAVSSLVLLGSIGRTRVSHPPNV